MRGLAQITFLFALTAGTALNADELLYRYDADVLPYDPTAGWTIFQPCDEGCSESLINGHFVITWPASMGSTTLYSYRIADPSPFPVPPAPPFWVEWRYSSNNAIHGTPYHDGAMIIDYNTALCFLNMYGDAIIFEDGGTFVTGLPLNTFRTYRFESTDGNHWCAWYDGIELGCRDGGRSLGANNLRIFGDGASPYSAVNRWDYVRYGRVTTGETIVSANPPAGYLDPEKYTNVDRFTVTFDQPNYVYVNDVTVEVLGAKARSHGGTEGDDPALALGVPMVTATRRQDNGPPDTVEIILDQPLAAGATYRFTFNTGAATPQTVEYIMTADPHPVIPTTTTWGLVVLSLLLTIAAKLNFPALPAAQ